MSLPALEGKAVYVRVGADLLRAVKGVIILWTCYGINFPPVLWIQIRIDLTLQDPDLDPYCECVSGSRSSNKEFDQN